MEDDEEILDSWYRSWLITLDEWCDRHLITREQAISILFDDTRLNPNPDGPDQVTAKDVLEWPCVQSYVSRFKEDDFLK